jgi:TonB family protein
MNSIHTAGLIATSIVFLLLAAPATIAASEKPESATPLSSAISPIVYPVDQSPSERGFHYIFYGNGFFINKEGYLLTAAHVLSQLRAAQPYLLLRTPMAPPRLVRAVVVAVDPDHDVALLRATPNPFEGRYQVSFLRLASQRPNVTREVLADALRPSRLKNPYTFDALQEDRPAGEVLEYRFTQLYRGQPDTEIFLFSHDVLLGDSGAPVVSGDSQEVVGLIEGRWLHGGGTMARAIPLQKQSSGLGAVVPVHYAIALLQQQGIAWQGVPEASAGADQVAPPEKQFAVPAPLSLVAAPYPSEVFSGGEVVLDARVEGSGKLGDFRTLGGESPFLSKVFSAVQTWTFRPARSVENVVETRLGIVFQFPSSLAAANASREHVYEGRFEDGQDRAAHPLSTPEPDTSHTKVAEGSVILCAHIDANGNIGSIDVVRGDEPLTTAVLSAVRQWRFAPGRRAGVSTSSEVIAVLTFRQLAMTTPAPSAKSTH